MKRENPDLYAALLLGILLHTLLCAQARYGAPRAGGWRPCWRPALHLNFCGSGS